MKKLLIFFALFFTVSQIEASVCVNAYYSFKTVQAYQEFCAEVESMLENPKVVKSIVRSAKSKSDAGIGKFPEILLVVVWLYYDETTSGLEQKDKDFARLNQILNQSSVETNSIIKSMKLENKLIEEIKK